MAATVAPTTVTDAHVVVPADVVGPVVVSFDERFVWSFSPPRDGVRTRAGWQVAWPEVLVPKLDGTTQVRLADPTGADVHFDDPVSFHGSSARLELNDAHGHPLSVDSAGHLTRAFSETGDDVRRHIVEGTARAIADLRDRIGIDAHVSYGCLLGAVREGRMIGHDSDSDLAYLSAHTEPADIILESYRMERELRELGWRVVRMSGADLKLFLPLPDGRTVHVDVFGAFHVGDVFYQLGGRSGHLPREALTPASTVVLEGIELAAPADPEAVLEFLYGPSWRVPDPAFQPVDPLPGLRRIDGWLRGFRTHVVTWNEMFRYRRGDIPNGSSTFATWAAARMPAGARVIDLGCGNGRDSVWFAGQEHPVVSFDFAGAALRQTRRKLTRHGEVDPDVRVLVLNDTRTALLAGAELARETEAPYLYARGLVGCLDEEARRNLWRLGSMALRRGGALFLEYAAAARGLPQSTTDGLVQRVDTDDLVREIEAAGGRVTHREEGPGQDFFDAPDPRTARLEVRWSPVPATPTHRPGAAMSESIETPRGFFRTALSLPELARDLKDAVHENRRLNRRIAELTDVVTELLIPVADRDEAKVQELLEAYRRTTLAP
ncbi:MAG: mucin-5AC [Marmoricola sp.]|nr:mucin-5AC [Marmoricola sp.]